MDESAMSVGLPIGLLGIIERTDGCLSVARDNKMHPGRGGDLGGTGGRSLQIFEVGDGPCIGPPISRKVVLSDARESTNRVKKWSYQGILF